MENLNEDNKSKTQHVADLIKKFDKSKIGFIVLIILLIASIGVKMSDH